MSCPAEISHKIGTSISGNATATYTATMKVSIYLTFNGNCKNAMNFYKSIFGGEFILQQSWGDSPMKDDTPEEFKHLIMHCALPVSNSFTLMGCDHHPVMHKHKHVLGNNTEIVLLPKAKAEADRLFAALCDGGSVNMPLQDMFWGSYSGSCKDKFGIQWLIDTPSSDMTGCPFNKGDNVLQASMKD